jgi:hypothetical protein
MTECDLSKPRTLRGEILDRARRLTEGERSALYGEPKDNFRLTAEIFNVLVSHRRQSLTPAEAAFVLVANKLARAAGWRGDPREHEDTFVDAAAYVAIVYELLVEEWDALDVVDGRS